MRYGLVALVLVLAACQTASNMVGSGPIVLPDGVKRYYEDKYLKIPGPAYFIVSDTGTWANFTYCSAGAGNCKAGTLELAQIDKCKAKAGTKCFIFAKGYHVVWKGKVKYGSGTSRMIIRASNTAKPPMELNDKVLCNYSIKLGVEVPVWDTKGRYADYVAEAERRNLTPEKCATLAKGS